MLEIKYWSESNFDFEEIARIQNLVNHDTIEHANDLKQKWENRDKTVLSEKYFLCNNIKNVGILHFSQGVQVNKRNCYFNIYMDPDFQSTSNYKILYDQLLKSVAEFDCSRLFPWTFLHSNYSNYITFLNHEGFKIVQKHREYKLDLKQFEISSFEGLLEKLKKEGVQIFETKNEMQHFPNHYKKLEELIWNYIQDEPIMDGDSHIRKPYERWMQKRRVFEDKKYGVELVAVKNDEYVGLTRVIIKYDSDSKKGYTETTGVLQKYRRQGIATALKVESIKKLKKKGIKEIRTGNEMKNPMYKINEKLGFQLMEQSLEFRKDI